MEACQSSSSFPSFILSTRSRFENHTRGILWRDASTLRTLPLLLSLSLAFSISLPPFSFSYRLYMCICLLISQHVGENFPSIGKKPERNRVTTPSRDPSPNRRKPVPQCVDSSPPISSPFFNFSFFFSSIFIFIFLFFFFFFESLFYFRFSTIWHPVTTV